MENIRSIITKPRQESVQWNFKSRRQEIVQEFVDKINQGRLNTNYKPVSAQQLNCRYLWTMSTWDLEVFYKKCRDSENFSRCFFGSFKKK